ncbi:probable mannan synthase 7 isoform X2 [Sorghum bicolor]|uniref:probable mannan synthase 7 isoform X2 n=1 Tax=Sorghum bicolor TaxID=4558 RepID=UPI0003C65884|nr:probable mannan synthase 7 isoform X2 [Sorghum bicolor]|eukprot:XP_021308674.1 probable mannan synthase 7 isoform X2 [Sorghum bicolor]
MEAGEIGGALLFVLAAAAAVAVAVSVGAVDFSRPLTGSPLDFQGAVSWLIGILDGTSSAAADVYGAWVAVRAGLIAPVLQVAVWACMVMSVMLVVEAVYNSVVSLGVKAIGWRPEWRFKWKPLDGADEEKGSAHFPMVLVQIPMYNELEVYKLSIAAACGLQWPKDRIMVQVLDDSTDPFIKNLVELECEHWANKGVNIKYATRTSRKGFKAGALKKGMECDYARQSEYIAIFDADFQPEPDFLLRTVPFLLHNPEVALVQARWSFVNGTTSLLTRVQKMFYDYHFKVEQEAGSATFAFFSFNGTAGVWRTIAIRDAGGWKDRTTVEDMDLAVRATLKGWKFVYVGDIRVKSELPSTYKAYCRQQFRWSSGGANLFRKMAKDVLFAKDISLVKKIHMLYSFFFVRRVVAPTAACILFNVIIPISVTVPELYLPVWGVAYIPMVLTIVTVIRHPKNLHIMPFWILFESVMTLHRMRAAVTGLLELEGFNQWTVTKKVGNDLEDTEVPLLQKTRKRLRDRVNFLEIGFSVFLFLCASYNLVFHGTRSYYLYMYLQGLAFLLLGLNFTGTCSCCQ